MLTNNKKDNIIAVCHLKVTDTPLGSHYLYAIEKDCNSCQYPGVLDCGRIICYGLRMIDFTCIVTLALQCILLWSGLTVC